MHNFDNWFKLPFLWLWLLPGLFPLNALAQECIVSVQHYSVPQGLSHRYVRYAIQSKQGFIWAATFDGLNRFDGFDFQQYTKTKDGLRAASCEHMSEDSHGRLWLSYSPESIQEDETHSFLPIDLFDPKTGIAAPLEEALQLPFSVKDIAEVQSGWPGDIYILLKSGKIYRYNGLRFSYLIDIPCAKPGNLRYSGKDLIGILCQDSLLQFDSMGQIHHLTLLPAACDFIRGNNGWFLVGKNQPEGGPALWTVEPGQAAQPFYFFDSNGHPINFNWDPAFETPVFADNENNWWVFYNQRLLLFSPKGQLLYDFSDDLKEIPFPFPSYITFDRRNTAWIGSTLGLLSVSIQKNPFTNYLTSEELTDTRGITQDEKGRMYVVQQGNAWRLNADSGAKTNLGMPVWLAAARDARGTLWFGDYIFKVHAYDPVSRERETYYSADTIGPGKFSLTQAIFTDPASGRVWIGTSKKGLAYIGPQEKAILPFTTYNQFQHLRQASIQCFLHDEAGLWLGTNQGVYLLEPGKGVTAEYSHRTGALPFDNIHHIYKDKEGLFWLATKGGGLIQWAQNRNVYRQFTQEDGLSHNTIHAVYEDKDEQLWLPSNYGLMRFDKRSFQVNTYLPRDGLPHEEFNFSSHYRAADGRLYFGGLGGVTAFYPEELYRETQQASASLGISQYLELDGATGVFADKTSELQAANGIRLPSRNKSFLLKIVFSDYQSPKDNRFAYRIEGLNKDWIYQPDNTIRINNLPFGSFTLHVKAQGANGRWSARELNLPLTVLRPFYLRWWFIGLCIALFFLAIAWRIRSLRQRAQELETEVQKRTHRIEQDKRVIEKQASELRELDEMKSRFFNNVAHELRTPITLIQGPLQLALEKTGLDKDTTSMLKLAQGNTKNLLNLVEELLDLKKLDAGKLTLQEQTVEFYSLMRRLVANFESIAQINDVELCLQYPEDQKLWLKLDLVKFERILLNLLSNAFKFTPARGRIRVTAEACGPWMYISVADTGQGIAPKDLPYVFDRYFQASSSPPQSPQRGEVSAERPLEELFTANPPPSGGLGGASSGGAGIGLAISREYAELMKGKLTATSKVGEGSVFTLVFPKKEVPSAFTSAHGQQLPEENSPREALPPLGGIKGGFSPPLREGMGRLDSTPPPPFEGVGGRLLLVEDNPDMRRYLQEILRPHYDILTAANGRIALDLLSNLTDEAEAPALVITDIMMPEMDGFELIRRLKSSPQWQGLPLIALTARTGLDDRLSALRFGVDDYLAKPFEPAELLARAANLLQNHQRRKEWLNAREAETEDNAYFLRIDPPQVIPTSEQQWLAELEALALDKIGGAEFSVTDLAHLLHLSERQLRRKLKELTGLSPGGYLNEIRLQRARQLLETHAYETVAEVSYAIGLSTPKHFSRLFKARFGKVPSSYF